MLTYTATNTKTGQFYIGSAQSYCHYMSRIGFHHTVKNKRGRYEFQKDLQADPLAFVWEWSEDGLNDRSTEFSLIKLYEGSPFLYNIGTGKYENRKTGWNHSEETKQRMATSAKKDSERRSKHLSSIVNKKEPCPHCGKLMNPGNLAQHIRAGTCQKN